MLAVRLKRMFFGRFWDRRIKPRYGSYRPELDPDQLAEFRQRVAWLDRERSILNRELHPK